MATAATNFASIQTMQALQRAVVALQIGSYGHIGEDDVLNVLREGKKDYAE